MRNFFPNVFFLSPPLRLFPRLLVRLLVGFHSSLCIHVEIHAHPCRAAILSRVRTRASAQRKPASPFANSTPPPIFSRVYYTRSFFAALFEVEKTMGNITRSERRPTGLRKKKRARTTLLLDRLRGACAAALRRGIDNSR